MVSLLLFRSLPSFSVSLFSDGIVGGQRGQREREREAECVFQSRDKKAACHSTTVGSNASPQRKFARPLLISYPRSDADAKHFSLRLASDYDAV